MSEAIPDAPGTVWTTSGYHAFAFRLFPIHSVPFRQFPAFSGWSLGFSGNLLKHKKTIKNMQQSRSLLQKSTKQATTQKHMKILKHSQHAINSRTSNNCTKKHELLNIPGKNKYNSLIHTHPCKNHIEIPEICAQCPKYPRNSAESAL